MFLKKPLFSGKTNHAILKSMISVLGPPSDEFVNKIVDEDDQDFMRDEMQKPTSEKSLE